MYVHKKSFNRVLGFACIGLWLSSSTCLGADAIFDVTLDATHELFNEMRVRHTALAAAWYEAKAAGRTECLSKKIYDYVDELASYTFPSVSKEEVALLNREVVETICSQKSSRSIASFSREEAENFSTFDLEALLEDEIKKRGHSEWTQFITAELVESLLSPQVQRAQEIAKALAPCPDVQKAYSEYTESVPGFSSVFMCIEVCKVESMVKREHLMSARPISLHEFRMGKSDILFHTVKEIGVIRAELSGAISPHTASGGSSSSGSPR